MYWEIATDMASAIFFTGLVLGIVYLLTSDDGTFKRLGDSI